VKLNIHIQLLRDVARCYNNYSHNSEFSLKKNIIRIKDVCKISVGLFHPVIFEVFHGGDYEECCFWGMTPCGCCKNRRFGGRYRFHHHGNNNRGVGKLAVTSNRRTLVTANVAPSSSILVTLMMGRYVPPKRRLLREPQGVTSQKTTFFMYLICRHFPLLLLTRMTEVATLLTISASLLRL
jgi:hypothetical protein